MITVLFAPITKEAAYLFYILFRIGVLIVFIVLIAETVISRTFFRRRIVIDSLCFIVLLFLWFLAKASSY